MWRRRKSKIVDCSALTVRLSHPPFSAMAITSGPTRWSLDRQTRFYKLLRAAARVLYAGGKLSVSANPVDWLDPVAPAEMISETIRAQGFPRSRPKSLMIAENTPN